MACAKSILFSLILGCFVFTTNAQQLPDDVSKVLQPYFTMPVNENNFINFLSVIKSDSTIKIDTLINGMPGDSLYYYVRTTKAGFISPIDNAENDLTIMRSSNKELSGGNNEFSVNMILVLDSTQASRKIVKKEFLKLEKVLSRFYDYKSIFRSSDSVNFSKQPDPIVVVSYGKFYRNKYYALFIKLLYVSS